MTLRFFDSHGGLPPGGPDDLGRRVAAYAAALAAAGGTGGCVQALPGREPETEFVAAVRAWPGLIPVPAWPGGDTTAAAPWLDRMAGLGATAIHVHPRACGLRPGDGVLPVLLRGAAARRMVVFFCTYGFAAAGLRLPLDPLQGLADALAEAPEARLVLLHGGGVELLRHAEFTRANPNLLLDLSFTLMKYPGSSVDLDIGFLCRHFDRRLCIGTDWPDYAPADVAARFARLCHGLPDGRRDAIAAGNLPAFLGLDMPGPAATRT